MMASFLNFNQSWLLIKSMDHAQNPWEPWEPKPPENEGKFSSKDPRGIFEPFQALSITIKMGPICSI